MQSAGAPARFCSPFLPGMPRPAASARRPAFGIILPGDSHRCVRAVPDFCIDAPTRGLEPAAPSLCGTTAPLAPPGPPSAAGDPQAGAGGDAEADAGGLLAAGKYCRPGAHSASAYGLFALPAGRSGKNWSQNENGGDATTMHTNPSTASASTLWAMPRGMER